jgi:hypothetical protein
MLCHFRRHLASIIRRLKDLAYLAYTSTIRKNLAQSIGNTQEFPSEFGGEEGYTTRQQAGLDSLRPAVPFMTQILVLQTA